MRLVERRREAESCLGKRRAPLPPDFSSGASPHHSVISDGLSQSPTPYTSSAAVRNEGDIKVVITFIFPNLMFVPYRNNTCSLNLCFVEL